MFARNRGGAVAQAPAGHWANGRSDQTSNGQLLEICERMALLARRS